MEIARQQFEFNRTEHGRKRNTEVRLEKPIKKVRDSEDYDWARRQATAEAKKAAFNALQAELVYRKEAGELIDRQLAVGISYQIEKHLTDSLRNLPGCLAQKTHVVYQAGGNEDDTRETMRLEIDTIFRTLSQEVIQFEFWCSFFYQILG